MSNASEEQALLEKAALQYDLKALYKHVERRRANIKIFENAIDEERVGIETDQKMITVLELRNGASK